MLCLTVNGAHESAHAMQTPVAAADTDRGAADSHHTPCTPFEHSQDYDGCDSCVNCACHASLTILPFQLNYNPSVSTLSTPDLFTFLPEVYLSKFVPPQIQA